MQQCSVFLLIITLMANLFPSHLLLKTQSHTDSKSIGPEFLAFPCDVAEPVTPSYSISGGHDY